MSNEHLSRANRCSQEGRKKKKKLPTGNVIRIFHIALMSHAAQVKKKKRGPMLKGRALYDKWDWIANKILAQ